MAAVAIFGLLAASEASAYVYVGNGPTIARANNNGTGLDPDFIKVDGFVCGVAVDSSHIYWSSRGSIGRANLNGTGVEQDFVSFPGSPDICGVAVTGTDVYWTDRSAQSIGRVGLNGKSPYFGFINPGYAPCGVAANGNSVYYGGNDGAHVLARADSSSGAALPFPGPTQVASCAVGLRAGNVYYGNFRAGDLTGIYQVTGGHEFTNIVGTKMPCGIAVTSSAAYWTNYNQPGGGSRGSVGMVPIGADGLATGLPNQAFITGISEPCGIAVDALPVAPPPDADGDGVPSATDACPNVAGPVSNHGCPLEPPDADGDGVPNATDGCPNVAGPVSNHGCPVKPSNACAKAEEKLGNAKAKLKKLRLHHAPRKKLKKAKRRVKKAKAAVQSACG